MIETIELDSTELTLADIDELATKAQSFQRATLLFEMLLETLEIRDAKPDYNLMHQKMATLAKAMARLQNLLKQDDNPLMQEYLTQS